MSRSCLSSKLGLIFFVCEIFCFIDPVGDDGGNSCHRKDHGGKLLIMPKEKLVNQGYIINDPSMSREVLEISDIFLEAIFGDSIRAMKGFLSKFTEFVMSVKGEKGGFEILHKFIKVLSRERTRGSTI